MATNTYRGIWVPLVTPFRGDRVDLDAAQRLAHMLVTAGVHGLVVCGTTGEAMALDAGEQLAMLQAVLEAAGSRCPVAMGLCGGDTRAVVSQAARFSRHDVAGFLIAPPYYVRPAQQGVILHYQAIASATDRPIVLYNIPARTGVNLSASTIATLARDPQFVAIKQCGDTIQQTVDLVNAGKLQVLCGDDALLFATLSLGGHGAISAAAHIRPDLMVHVYELMMAGRTELARGVFNQLLPMIRLLFSEPNPGPVKAALALQGHIAEELRLPMTPMSQPGKDQLARMLDRVAALPAARAGSGRLHAMTAANCGAIAADSAVRA